VERKRLYVAIAVVCLVLGARGALAAPAPLTESAMELFSSAPQADWNISGTLQAMNGQFWNVQGFSFRVDASTVVTGGVPTIGSHVSAEGIVLPDGTWLARRVRVGDEGTATNTPTSTSTGTASPTNTPTTASTATATNSPTATPTNAPTNTPTATPSSTAQSTLTPASTRTKEAEEDRDDQGQNDDRNQGKPEKPDKEKKAIHRHGPPPWALLHGNKNGFFQGDRGGDDNSDD
jgi:hypothetical protein